MDYYMKPFMGIHVKESRHSLKFMDYYMEPFMGIRVKESICVKESRWVLNFFVETMRTVH